MGQIFEICLQRGGVHGDEHVGGVARGHDVVVGEMELEGRDTGQGAGWRADLSGEVGQGRQVVAQAGGLGGEPVTGELHAIAGVPRKADDDAAEIDDLLGHATPRG